jgi:hypothetical protein
VGFQKVVREEAEVVEALAIASSGVSALAQPQLGQTNSAAFPRKRLKLIAAISVADGSEGNHPTHASVFDRSLKRRARCHEQPIRLEAELFDRKRGA